MPAPVITLIAYITSSLWFKISYGITLSAQTMFMIQKSMTTDEKMLDIFLSNTSAKVLYGFSIVYMLSKIVDACINSWKKWKISKLEIKMKEEDLESKEIENDIQRKDLKDGTIPKI